jgi:hypothetical protein
LKTKVQGQSLVIAAPTHIARANRQINPRNVKAKVAKANLDTGWSSVGGAQAKEQLKQKFRNEDASKVRASAAAGVTAQPGVATSPAGANAATSAAASANTEVNRGGKNRGARQGNSVPQNRAVEAGSSPAGSTDLSPNTNMERGRGGKHRNRENEQLQQQQTATGATGGSIPPAGTTATENNLGVTGGSANELNRQGRGKHEGRRAQENAAAGAQTTTAPAATSEGATGAGTEGVNQGGGKHNRRNQAPTGAPEIQSQNQLQSQAPTTGGTDQVPGRGQGQGRRARELEPPQGGAPTDAAPPADVQGQGVGKHHGQVEGQPQIQGAAVQPGAAPAVQPAPGQQGGGGKRNKNEASPVPSPQ